jgi:hypothetical protein
VDAGNREENRVGPDNAAQFQRRKTIGDRLVQELPWIIGAGVAVGAVGLLYIAMRNAGSGSSPVAAPPLPPYQPPPYIPPQAYMYPPPVDYSPSRPFQPVSSRSFIDYNPSRPFQPVSARTGGSRRSPSR